MAIYSFRAQIIGRSSGQSTPAAASYRSGTKSVAASAAYRAAEKLKDERANKTYDFSRKEGVVKSFIMTPDNAPAWAQDRYQLWNKVEATEDKRSTRPDQAQLAREFVLALPHELTDDEREVLVRAYVQREFISRNLVADVALHRPSRAGDDRNEHAHVMVTTRALDGEGFARRKDREMNARGMLRHWRERWSRDANRALERAGQEGRIDHRTLEEQRAEALREGRTLDARLLDREPQIHVGPVPAHVDRFVRGPAREREARRIVNERIKQRNLERFAQSEDPDIRTLAEAELARRQRLNGIENQMVDRERQHTAVIRDHNRLQRVEQQDVKERAELVAQIFKTERLTLRESQKTLKQDQRDAWRELFKRQWLETPKGREITKKQYYGAAWRELKERQHDEMQAAGWWTSGALKRSHSRERRDLYQWQQWDLNPGLMRRLGSSIMDKLKQPGITRRHEEERAALKAFYDEKWQVIWERDKEIARSLDQIQANRSMQLSKLARDHLLQRDALLNQHRLEVGTLGTRFRSDGRTQEWRTALSRHVLRVEKSSELTYKLHACEFDGPGTDWSYWRRYIEDQRTEREIKERLHPDFDRQASRSEQDHLPTFGQLHRQRQDELEKGKLREALGQLVSKHPERLQEGQDKRHPLDERHADREGSRKAPENHSEIERNHVFRGNRDRRRFTEPERDQARSNRRQERER